jgi:eukaryotic-like serine/threonine-protein kinase
VTQTDTGKLAGQTLDGFQLESLLGVGGMAEVYRGRDTKLGRAVAIKVLHPTFAADPGYVERFRNEARRVAALNHPHIVPVYQYGEANGYLYLVMPLLEESLREKLDRERPLPIVDSAKLIVQIASALDVAHSKGLVHRDVKPENILLNAEGKGLLTDFGIARELSLLSRGNGNLTLAATGLPIGTPEYMAPEQLRNEAIDQRVDIYALGAVLYEMLTGVAPHEAGTPYEVAALALTTPIVLPSRRNADISPELEQVMLTALANEPAHRYKSMRDFARALRAVVLSTEERIWRPTMLASRKVTIAMPPLGQETYDDRVEPLPLGGGVATALATEAATDSGPRSWVMPALPQPRGRRSRVLVATSAALLVALFLAGGSVLLLNSTLASSGGALGLGRGVLSSLPGLSATATSTTGDNQATPGATPGAHPSPTVRPGATVTPGGQPTATPNPQATATPTAIPPPSVSISPTSWQMSSPKRSHCHSNSSETYSNTGNDTLSWSWGTPSPALPSNFSWSYGGASGGSSNLPSDSSLAPGNSDLLSVISMDCNSGDSYSITVTVTDTATNATQTFPITLTVP